MKFNNQIAPDQQVQSALSPADSIEILKSGNQRFLSKSGLSRDLNREVEKTATGQFPFAAVVSCIDSRIPTEIIFDQGIGDIFNARIAGNFINEDILGSLEFACKLAGSNLIVVMGHTSCGAVKGAVDGAKLGNLTQMLAKIQPAVDAIETAPGEARNSSNLSFVNKVSAENVRLTVQAILDGSEVLKVMSDANTVQIVGAMYDVKNGQVSFL